MMLLLDTHTLLWFLTNDPRLSAFAKTALEDPANRRWLSPISLMEIAIKVRSGKLPLQRPYGTMFPAELHTADIHLLPLEPQHIEPLTALPLHHKDPKRLPEMTNEISHLFVSPLVPVEVQPLDDLQARIDALAFQMYGIEPDDLPEMERGSDSVPDENEGEENDEPRLPVDSGQWQKNMLSYAIGCILGRWDIRYAIGEKPAPDLPDPFAPLPVCSPGMLQGDDGLPLRRAANLDFGKNLDSSVIYDPDLNAAWY